MTPSRGFPGPAGRVPLIFACFFLSGATGLVHQVVWLRMLGLVFWHTVYAITTVLAAFMGGLALGSYLFARSSARIRNLIRAYGWLEIGIGVYCALLPAFVWVTSALYLSLHGTFGFSYDTFNLAQFALGFALFLVPTTLMGGTLPILSQALIHEERGLGQKVGALYATNTFGAVVGVVLAGYLVLPALGTRSTVAIAAATNLGPARDGGTGTGRRRSRGWPRPLSCSCSRPGISGSWRAAPPCTARGTWRGHRGRAFPRFCAASECSSIATE